MMSPEQIARVCHEANRAYCLSRDEGVVAAAWEDCGRELRLSAITGVEKALDGATPKQMHESWMKERTANGWTFGGVKDFTHKTHPCLVPYDQLPEAQKVKDELFLAIVDALDAR